MILPEVFWDRMVFMALGGTIGLILGLLLNINKETREAHKEMHDWIIAHKDEKGQGLWHNIALIACVVLVAYAAFASQLALNHVHRESDCTQTSIVDTLDTLGERSTYTVDQALANKDLQLAQAEYIETVLDQSATRNEMREALNRYFDTLTEFTQLATANAQKLQNHPLPKSKSYKECLDE